MWGKSTNKNVRIQRKTFEDGTSVGETTVFGVIAKFIVETLEIIFKLSC